MKNTVLKHLVFSLKTSSLYLICFYLPISTFLVYLDSLPIILHNHCIRVRHTDKLFDFNTLFC